jgi:acetyl esterase/lipase
MIVAKSREERIMADDASGDLKTAGKAVIPLWPEGPPSVIEGVGPEAAYIVPAGVAAGTTMLRNISAPSLTVFEPAPGTANGVGVIVVPGGGWRILAWEHEGLDVARWFADRGYTAFLLKYRVMGTSPDPVKFLAGMAAIDAQLAAPTPAAKAPRAMDALMAGNQISLAAREIAADDGRRALEIVRGRAGEWGLTPERIGMIGFSAGAFLVADMAVDPRAAPMAFVAPIYGGETRGKPVPADAPPLFTLIAQDDRLLFKMVEGLYADWSNADRPAELHIFARGAHGFGMVKQGLPVDRWIDLLGDWLADQGFA